MQISFGHRLLMLAAVSLRLAVGAPAPSSFPALDAWAAAVNGGDLATLQKTYGLASTHMEPAKVQQEIGFWAGLKSSGVTEVSPKILSLEQQDGRTVLVLRIYAKQGGRQYVSGASQLWQQAPEGWQLVAWKNSAFGLDAGRSLPEPAKPNTALYPPPSEAREEVKAAAAKAAREHKRVLVVFGANWCYDCHVLDTTFHSGSFAQLVAKNFVVVHVNIGDEGRDNNDLAKAYGVALDKGVPNMAVLDPGGKVVVAQHGEFEATAKIGPDDVRAFLEKWKPAPH